MALLPRMALAEQWFPHQSRTHMHTHTPHTQVWDLSDNPYAWPNPELVKKAVTSTHPETTVVLGPADA